MGFRWCIIIGSGRQNDAFRFFRLDSTNAAAKISKIALDSCRKNQYNPHYRIEKCKKMRFGSPVEINNVKMGNRREGGSLRRQGNVSSFLRALSLRSTSLNRTQPKVSVVSPQRICDLIAKRLGAILKGTSSHSSGDCMRGCKGGAV